MKQLPNSLLWFVWISGVEGQDPFQMFDSNAWAPCIQGSYNLWTSVRITCAVWTSPNIQMWTKIVSRICRILKTGKLCQNRKKLSQILKNHPNLLWNCLPQTLSVSLKASQLFLVACFTNTMHLTSPHFPHVSTHSATARREHHLQPQGHILW